jgi:hypothetical protein
MPISNKASIAPRINPTAGKKYRLRRKSRSSGWIRDGKGIIVRNWIAVRKDFI